MHVDMGKMQRSEGRKPLSLSSKGRIKRKDKNKGKKSLEQLYKEWRQSMLKQPKRKSQNHQVVLTEIVGNRTEIDLN